MDSIQAHMRAGQWDSALDECQALLRQQPTNAKLHDYLGVCQSWKGDYESAAVSFQRASTLDEMFIDAGVRYVQCLTQLRRYEEAMKEANHWYRLAPNDRKLIALMDFLKEHAHGEFQRWEMHQRVNTRIVMAQDED